MCSICGYFSNVEVPTRIVTDMLQKTEHRGPDAHGLYADGEIWRSREVSDLESSEKARICLGHSELSIVSGDEGVIQPFRSSDGTLSLVHNGEIYNSQELQGLLSKDHVIADGDNNSKILLHLLEEIYDGDLLRTVQSVVTMLNGMYVFAVTAGDD